MKNIRLLQLLVALAGVTSLFAQSEPLQPDSAQPLVNLSTRATISPANPRVTVGFTVPNNPDSSRPLFPKSVLLRAVGPGLAVHGVDSPLADPVVKIFDAAGSERSANWTYDPTQPVDTDQPNNTVESRLATAASVSAVSSQLGAFPVPVPTAEALVVADYAVVAGLPDGNYTMVVSSASGGTGDVLVEIYSVHN